MEFIIAVSISGEFLTGERSGKSFFFCLLDLDDELIRLDEVCLLSVVVASTVVRFVVRSGGVVALIFGADLVIEPTFAIDICRSVNKRGKLEDELLDIVDEERDIAPNASSVTVELDATFDDLLDSVACDNPLNVMSTVASLDSVCPTASGNRVDVAPTAASHNNTREFSSRGRLRVLEDNLNDASATRDELEDVVSDAESPVNIIDSG
jgi:hypothetical protein